MRTFFTLIFSVFLAFSFQTEETPVEAEACKILHEGTFTYGPKSNSVRVEIKKDKHIEYHNEGKYILKSTIEWTSDCAYTATLIKVTIPDFPFKIGTQMKVKINKVEGDEIFYTAEVNGDTWDGKFTKVK